MPEEKAKIKLGLVEFAVEFDTASLMFFEETTGRSLSDFVSSPRMSDAIHLLWAAVRRVEPKMTLEEVQRLVPPRRFAEAGLVVAKALADALGTAMPEAAEEKLAAPLVPSGV